MQTQPIRRPPPKNLTAPQVVLLIVALIVGAVGWMWLTHGGPASVATGSFVVNVRGTTGTPFTLQCMAVQLDGSSASQSFSGLVPADFPDKAHLLSCVAQNKSADGRLTMQFTKDGQVVKTSDTTSAYGTVQIATQ